jgi:hypothetical protein
VSRPATRPASKARGGAGRDERWQRDVRGGELGVHGESRVENGHCCGLGLIALPVCDPTAVRRPLGAASHPGRWGDLGLSCDIARSVEQDDLCARIADRARAGQQVSVWGPVELPCVAQGSGCALVTFCKLCEGTAAGRHRVDVAVLAEEVHGLRRVERDKLWRGSHTRAWRSRCRGVVPVVRAEHFESQKGERSQHDRGRANESDLPQHRPRCPPALPRLRLPGCGFFS